MQETETVYPNDTTRQIQGLIADLIVWKQDNPSCDQRHTAMVITKLEEAELLSLRMVIQDD